MRRPMQHRAGFKLQMPNCPQCNRHDKVRSLGFFPGTVAKHYVCDKCKIGWTQARGARSAEPMTSVTKESAKALYRQESYMTPTQRRIGD